MRNFNKAMPVMLTVYQTSSVDKNTGCLFARSDVCDSETVDSGSRLDCSTETNVVTASNITPFTKWRKKMRNVEQWEASQQKPARQTGQQYTSFFRKDC